MRIVSDHSTDPEAKWWHVDGGLSLSKASLGLFMYTCLKLGIYVTNFWAFNPQYERSSVFVPIRCYDDQLAALKQAMPKLKVITPPKVDLN